MANPDHSSETRSPAEPSVDGPSAKKKPAKPDLANFLESLHTILTTEKDPLVKLRPLIKEGFIGEVNSEVVSKVVEALMVPTDVAERLALPMAVHERFGKLKPLSRVILAALRASFESAILYDSREFSGYRAPRAIEDWISERAPRGSQAERDVWFRRFVVCVLHESEPKTMLTGIVAASRIWMSSRPQKTSSEEAIFARSIAVALSSPAIGFVKLELVLAGVAAVDVQFRQMLNRELGLERQIREQQDSIDAFRKRVSSLEGDVATAREDAADKALRIRDLEQSLAESAERYELLDRHWRGVSEQQLAKQSGGFREKVSHEVEEALLALDREDPNKDMALERMRRIKEILQR